MFVLENLMHLQQKMKEKCTSSGREKYVPFNQCDTASSDEEQKVEKRIRTFKMTSQEAVEKALEKHRTKRLTNYSSCILDENHQVPENDTVIT